MRQIQYTLTVKQLCQKKGGILHADHIVPLSKIVQDFSIKTINYAENCETLGDMKNGRTLCKTCHQGTATYGGRVTKLLKKTGKYARR